jgi:DNA-binding transcriptional MerR regulator
MTPQPDEHSYGFREAAALLDVEESLLRYWAQTGLVSPSGRRGTRSFYTFADLIVLRAARELSRRGVGVASIRPALQALLGALPADRQALHRLRVGWDGTMLVFADEGEQAAPGVELFRTGDLRLRIDESARTAGDGQSAYHHFLLGCRLDHQDGRAADAERAYRCAVEIDPALGSAWTNLGNLLHRRGDGDAARRCYERAIEVEPDQPEARYNLANLLDQAGESEMAIAEYERTLRVAPDFADAHHNLALALERIGAVERAQAHRSRYHELSADRAG